jgi:hypothetical protein
MKYKLTRVKADEYSGGEECYVITDERGNYIAKSYSQFVGVIICLCLEKNDVNESDWRESVKKSIKNAIYHEGSI